MSPRATIRVVSFLSVILGSAVSVPAAQLKEAQVTQVVKDVKLLPTGAAARPATVNDEVRDGIAVRTGVDSRSELKFTDQTLARLGANTLFSFSEGTRNLNLQDGAMLLRVPKGAGGAKINSSAVTAAITGTTVMVETHALTKKNKNSYYKFIVLEGTARLYLPGRLGESTLVKAGQMIIMRADSKMIPEPVDIDIGKITQSSLLVTGFSTPLGSEALIAFEKTKQNEQKSSGQLYETNLMIYGGGTNVVLADPNTVDVTVSAESNAAKSPTPTPTATPTPSPAPSKFGTPSPISSPNPYVITSGTTITTDPSVTTNGITDYGKIYRGPTDDGAFSQWAFGSTSAFDTALNIDTEFFTDPAHLPIAVFKFQALSLIGNPTIDTSNSGVTNLGLIGVDGITSGPPGGVLTFSGINLLALARVNGSINLTSDVSFQNLNILAIYARGAAPDLTLNSSLSNIGALKLAAEQSIQITNAGTLSVGGFDATTGGGNLAAQVGALSLDGEARFNAEVLPSATITNGANIILNVTNDLTNNSTTDLSRFRVTNEGHIGTGGNILVSIGGDYTSGDVEASIDNSNGGHIGTGANIILSTGGDLSANSLFVFLNNRNEGVIDSGGNVNVAIGGNLTTAGDVTIGTSARYDDSGGGTIGSDALVGLTANSVSAGGFFQSFISTNAGGSIAGNAQNVVAVSGDLSANGGILIATYDTGFLSVNPTTFIAGGTIGGNASVLLTAQDILTTSTASGTPGLDIMALEASIYTNGSGSIGGNADVVVQAQQNISAPGTSFFTVANGNFQGFGGGTIGGDALIDVGAVNFSTGPLSDDIYNYLGGRIGNNASINLALSGALSVQGDTLFRILNYGNSDGLEGGQIGENATISVAAASIQAASLLAEINNSQGGQIGGSASINVFASGAVVVTNDATFRIDGSDGATSAAVNFNGGNYNVGGTFLGFIDGNGTFTLNNATIAADTVKVGLFGSNGTLRIGGGNISANTLLHLYAPSSSGSGGIIDFVSNVTLNSSATAAVIAANTVTIENGVVVTIGASTSANVYTNVPNYSARSGGNNKTSGTFVGAVTTQPLGGQPPFDSPSTRVARRSTRTSAAVIHVTDSSQLSSLLDNASPGPNGKVRVSPVTRSRNAPVQGSTRTMGAELHRSVAAKARSGVLASRL